MLVVTFAKRSKFVTAAEYCRQSEANKLFLDMKQNIPGRFNSCFFEKIQP